MEEVEIWKDIKEFPNYQVSTLGRVKSLNYNHTGKEKLLKLQKNRDGYLYVRLYNNKHPKYFLVHRLVAKCFLEPIEGKDIVNHKDENPSNNHVDNLEFCTVQYNNTYNNAHIKRGEKYKGKNNWNYGKHHTEETKKYIGKLKSIPILQYSLDGEFLKEWESGKIASETLNINYCGINNCCKGRYKTSGNFIWKYKYPTNN